MHHHNACAAERFHRYSRSHRKDTCARDEKRCGIGFSLMLIAVGTLFLLQHLGMLGGYAVTQFWPLAIMIPALSGLFRARHWSGRIFAIVILVFSDLALVHSLQLFAVPWGLIWPVFVVALGAAMMAMVALFPRKSTKVTIPETVADSPDMLNSKIICGGKEDDFGTGVFKGGLVDIFMGGYELDLRAARMEADEAELFLKVKLAGVKIRVPQDWEVLIDGDTFMGAIEDNSSCRGVDVKKRLLITASVRQGAIEINN
ncbi:MAG: hypothetical protein JXX29_05270 [Deltaproteobacteria bacterium]|nr:hypothetical protein [Deltaproteobacteria bacterium]MBN2671058.1 hypothetical protein [Deltaproteobacteria bacterium]